MAKTPTQPTAQSRTVAIAAILLLTALSGVVHGYLDGRWSVAADKVAQGERLDQLPKKIGPWVLVDDQELSESVEKLLRCYGSIVRVYRNIETDAMVNVAVTYGPRGPISVHTPEVCYSSAGTRQTRQRRAETFTTKDHQHQLWSVDFSRNDDPEASLRVMYGWSDGGAFVAADNPRFWLTEDLYKIQVAGPISRSAFDPCTTLIETLLPELEKQIQ